jgi:hypothetical protein
MNRFFLLALALAALTGCMTPPGKLTDADFNIRQVEYELPVKDVAANFRDGIRYCGSESGLILVVPYGIPDCGGERSDGSSSCDLYLDKGMGMGRSQVVLGIVEFKPTSATKTQVRFKVQTFVANQQTILNSWEKFAIGRHKDVCN